MLPGSSSSRSVKLVGWRWAMASRSILDAEVMPDDSRAVTTTSSSACPTRLSFMATVRVSPVSTVCDAGL